ncbi:MAG: endonuclease/exonuclease/phosphatase family protein [Phaeodactylibacter sp.]|nr:endonuclease/exonuclease/phosphatase family protein [Phaeodactylibacter sp.]
MSRKHSFSFLFLFWILTSSNWLPQRTEWTGFRVMTFNVLFSSLDMERTAEVLTLAQADLIALQECSPYLLKELAARLGYFFYPFPKNCCNLTGTDTGLLSRYPLDTGASADLVQVQLPNGEQLDLVNMHTLPFHYVPDLLRARKIQGAQAALRYSTESERNEQVEAGLLALSGSTHALMIGDFNEPSHLDWTAATADRHFGLELAFPLSKKMAQQGFKDAFREYLPDPQCHPGATWDASSKDPEVEDRIDYIYYRSAALQLEHCFLIGESTETATDRLEDFPSDHRAVMPDFRWIAEKTEAL